MSGVTMEVALCAAVNLLRDAGTVRKMPNGEQLDDAVVEMLLDAADILEHSRRDLEDCAGGT